ncbi:uncharacterized protein LOC141651879 [Silene latifolia]|uniref:uncharacterized protein LOC141651879 n=1 Tax=Silene latifolia TaxID=37657 RepID=UPI003D77E304
MELQAKPFWAVSLLQQPSGHWDYDAVLNICGQNIAPLVCSIPIPLQDDPYYLYWNLTSNGRYSSKSGYALTFSRLWDGHSSLKDRTRMDSSTIAFCKKILWHLPVFNKWKIFLWKLLSKSLSCGEEAQRRDLPWDYSCLFCTSQSIPESLAHLFRDCPFASRIWAASSLGIRSHVGNSVSIQQWVINWLKYFRQIANPLPSISLFVSSLWHIWCLRNKLVFQNGSIDYYDLLSSITMEANNNARVELDRHKHMGTLQPANLEDVDDDYLLRHHFPLCIIGLVICSTHIRIKCDASWTPNFTATVGWLFQDGTGTIFHVGRTSFWAKSAFQAEALALNFACADAIKHGYRHIDATSDCLSLVLQLNGCGDINQDAASILRSIMSFVSLCHCFSLSHCPRRLNRIAHAIVKSIA